MAGKETKTTTLVADGIIIARKARLIGIHFVNTVGAGIAADIYDNASAASGTVVLSIPALAAGSDSLTFGNDGIRADNGLYLDINGLAGVIAIYE